jgi:hypothetical protein
MNINKQLSKVKIPVVVMSTDSYSDVWNHFFALLEKYWPNDSLELYLITETKIPEIDNVNVVNIKSNNWSGVLLGGLKKIAGQHVILILDDMLIVEKVNQDLIKKTFNFIQLNNDIACITIGGNDTTRVECEYKDNPNFLLVAQDSPFRVTTSPSIWNKKHLIELIEEGESPWQFELNGTRRAKNNHVFFLNLKKSAIYTFFTRIGNTAIIRGFWQHDAVQFLESLGQVVNLKLRKVSFKTLPAIWPIVKVKRFFKR